MVPSTSSRSTSRPKVPPLQLTQSYRFAPPVFDRSFLLDGLGKFFDDVITNVQKLFSRLPAQSQQQNLTQNMASKHLETSNQFRKPPTLKRRKGKSKPKQSGEPYEKP